MKKKINPIWFLIGILAIFVGIPLGIFLYFYIGIQLPLILETFHDYRYVWLVAIVGLLVQKKTEEKLSVVA